MAKSREAMPTQATSPQLGDAIMGVFDSNFRLLYDDERPDVVRPVFYEPVFFDEADDRLLSQRILYVSTQVARPPAAHKAIDTVQAALDQISPELNPVKHAMDRQASYPSDKSDFLDELLPVVKAQTENKSRTIGGLLMVKDAETNHVGLRCVYNRALMEVGATWQLRDLALDGHLGDDPNVSRLKSRDPHELGNVVVGMVLHCLAASEKLKPSIVFAPNLGFRGL